jgi:hypothetical protein
MSLDSTTLDSHTIPIIFGTLGLVFASIAIAVNVAFGILQIRAFSKRVCDDVEHGKGGTIEKAIATTNRQYHGVPDLSL